MRTLPTWAIGVSCVVGLIFDPLAAGTPWWSYSPLGDLVSAMVVPVFLWLAFVAAIIGIPRLLRVRPNHRLLTVQALWIAALSAIAWVPGGLLIADAFEFEGSGNSRIALVYSGVALLLAIAATFRGEDATPEPHNT